MAQKVFLKRAVLYAAFAMVLVGCGGTNSPAGGGDHHAGGGDHYGGGGGHHGGGVITWEVFAEGWPTTGALYFMFTSDPGHLEPWNFTIGGAWGGWAAPESVLSLAPNMRVVTISSVVSGPASVSIHHPWGHIAPTSREVMLHRDDPSTGGLPGDSTINWTVRTQGANGETNRLIFDFTSNPGSLQATHITLTSIAPAAVMRHQLSGSGTTRTLNISTFAPGNISISINFGNINRASQTVRVENIWAQ